MVVCKFFQQGNCRFGQSCRFDHIYGSKYSYHAAPANQPAPSAVTDEQLVNQVVSDVKAALNGGQWILSCYSPFKEKPNFPGISDLSPEEARLFIYEAKANNNVDQAVSYMNHLITETRQKYEQLLKPTLAIITVLKSLYRGETVASPFTTGQSRLESSSAATSIFRSAVQGTSVFGQNPTNSSPSVFSQNTNSSPSIFGQSQGGTNSSVFGQNANAGFGQNSVANQKPSVFGSPTADSAKSIFAQATQNVFGPSSPTNVFAPANADPAKSIFAQANQSVFTADQTPANNAASIFNTASQSVFGNTNDPFNEQQTPASPFGRPAQNVFEIQADDSSIYSDINNLSPEDLEAFKADDFKIGFIPEMPPPRSLCF